MNRLPEITGLFATLASNLQTLSSTVCDEDQTSDLSITSLNRSLNLGENSRLRVLDTALSLMCFRAPQVFDSVIQYLVDTIVTVLSSSITCKVLRYQKAEIFSIGSTISSADCAELIEVCSDALTRLGEHGMLSHSLLHAVVRVAVSASCFQYALESTSFVNVKSSWERKPAVSKLLYHLPKEITLNNQEIPLRLMFWYLDPLILKNDLSQILQDAVGRPFLCLNVAFYEKTAWRSIIICLALSPSMFIETRALLHNWFLMTGLATVLELQVQLVSLILDVVSRPMWWGLPMELGSGLPSSQAYFPHTPELLRTLVGPFSCENFLRLVHCTSKLVRNARRSSNSAPKEASIEVALIDHKSRWAMAMNFPDWFFFSSLMLFSDKSTQDSFHSRCTEESQDLEVPCSSVAAARYIAWILDPINEYNRDLLVDSLSKVSKSWTLKQFSSDNRCKETEGYRKKLKRLKFHDMEDDCGLLKHPDCRTIELWLVQFQNMCINYWNEIPKSSKSSHGISLRQNVLFQKIPLGILIGCPTATSEYGCDLLLHYAATGSILRLTEVQTAGLKNKKWTARWREDSVIWGEQLGITEAMAGACLVFRLTDVVENISASMFETVEDGINFICQVKLISGKYLLKCIKKLLQLKIDEDELMLRDLCSRLAQWRVQGRDVFQGSKDMDDAIRALGHKLSSF